MATGRSNNKSTQIASRVPHEVIEEMEKVKDDGESTGQFIVAALRGEIKRRQRKLAKEDPKG
ncbi:YlcI/YnfO family protein [Pseudescherichia sp.]|uniref:YlcI/YnfO family protein n=1 Tax=Pseudescherichia sp. TaxID=2055881 RepID=UPI0028AFC850|nr:YlcI/YnfO family protein [Pseudescherichia sp.]